MSNRRMFQPPSIILFSLILFCLLIQSTTHPSFATPTRPPTSTPTPTPTSCPEGNVYMLTVDKTAVSISDIITISHGFAAYGGTWSISANGEPLANGGWDVDTEWLDTAELRNVAPNQYEVIGAGDITLQLSGYGEVPFYEPSGTEGECNQGWVYSSISSSPVILNVDGSDGTDLPDLTITSYWLAYDERRCRVIGIQYTILNQSAVPVSSFDVQYVGSGEIHTVSGLAARETAIVVFEGANRDPGLPSAIVDPSNIIAESDETNNTFTPEWPLPTPTQAAHCQTPQATTPAPIVPTPDCISPTPTPDNIYPTSTPHPDCVITPPPTPTPDCITPTPTPTPNDFQPTPTSDNINPTPTLTPHPDCPTATPTPTPTPNCYVPTPTPPYIYPTSTPHPDCLTETPPTPTPTLDGDTVDLPDLTVSTYWWAFDDRGCRIIGVEYTIVNQSATDAPAFDVVDLETGLEQSVTGLAAGESTAVVFEDATINPSMSAVYVDAYEIVAESDENNNEFMPQHMPPIPPPSIYCETPEATPSAPTTIPDCTSPTATPDNINPTSTPHPYCDSSNWPAYVADLTIVSHDLAFDDRGCAIFGVAFTIFNRSLAPAYAFEVMYVDTGEIQTVAELEGGETIVVTFEGGNYYGGLPSAIVDPSNVVLGDIEENNEYVPQFPLPIPTQSLYCLTPPAITTTPIPETPTSSNSTPNPTATSDADADTSGSNTPLSVTLDRVEGTAAPFGLIALVVATTLLLAGSCFFARKH